MWDHLGPQGAAAGDFDPPGRHKDPRKGSKGSPEGAQVESKMILFWRLFLRCHFEPFLKEKSSKKGTQKGDKKSSFSGSLDHAEVM